MTDLRIEVVGDKALYARMAALRGFFQSRELKVVVEEAKNRLVRTARDAAPRKSRFLVRSIEGVVEGFGTDNVAIRVGSVARYAPHVEFGTKPHPIVPRSRKSLFWVRYAGGAQVNRIRGKEATETVFTFARSVNHPGTRPQPFLNPALDAVKPRFLQALERLLASKIAEGK